MNTKRILTFIISLLMVLFITLGLTACDEIFDAITSNNCQHQWEDATCTEAKTCTLCGETEGDPLGHTVVKDEGAAPTCTDAGLTEGSHCSVCNKVIKEQTTIPATGHTYGEWYVVTAAGCESAGLERRDCSCGHSETRDISETGHDYEATVTAPTCTEQGYTTYTCACGDTYIGDYVAATDHSWDEGKVTTAPTCLEDGVLTKTCQNGCGETKAEDIPATGHTHESKVTAPTCTEQGYTTHTCHCGDTYKDDYVAATGHSYGEWTVDSVATCVADGTERRDCEDCDHYETRLIPATGHTYESKETAPTCTEQGYTTHTCHCGDTYKDTFVAATGHSWDEGEVTKAPTCTEKGVLTKTCQNGCGETEAEDIPAKGHTHESKVTAPTCTEQGYTTYTCACGDTYKDTFVAATGHSWDEGEVTTEPTCTEQGVLTKTCQNGCGETEAEDIPAKGHTHESKVTAPTCTEQGYTTHTCACGDTYKDTYVDPLGHNYGEWEEVENPENEDETHIRYCSRCGESETNPHEYTSVVTAPTCTEKGYTTYTCGCGYVKVDDYVAATGHSWDEGKVTTAPTCLEDGVLTKTCQNGCGETKEEVISATGHSHESVVTAPTCEEQGYTTYTCACGDTYKDDYVAATGHSYGEWTVDSVATCVADGTERRDCEDCDHYETRLIPATGHTYESKVTAPTCEEQGYTTYTCACGDTYKDDYVAATGHSYGEWTVDSAATCVADGTERRDCEDCDHYETRLIPATGHTYESKETAPTCTDQGYTTHTCHCGDTYKDTFVAATGHSWDEGEVTTEPTCTEQGVLTKTCQNGCGETKEAVVPATGHSYKYVVTAPTCEEKGYTTYTCHCSDTYVDDYVDAIGHTYSKVVTAPTCTEGGYTTYTCVADGCNDTYVDDETEALGHVGGEADCTNAPVCSVCGAEYGKALGHTMIDATCTEAAHCKNCDYTEGTVLEHTMIPATCTEAAHCENCDHAEGTALGHTGGKATCTALAVCERCKEEYGSFGAHEYTEESTDERYLTSSATCEKAAVYAYSCACGEKGSGTFVHGGALGHSYSSWSSNDDGTHSHSRTCARCEDVETESCSGGEATCTLAPVCDVCKEYYGEALGHSYGEGTVSTSAGCTTDGVMTYTCSCGVTKTEAIPATGHSYDSVVTDPTCTAKGYTTHTCKNEGCQHKYVDSYVDATGHSFGEWAVEKAATCTATGLEVRVCGTCNHKETNTIAALGHDYAHEVTAPTCTTKGYTTHTCQRAGCGDTYVSDYVDAKGHDYEAAVTAPTCTEKGYTTYTCTNDNCEYSYRGSYVEANDHSYGDWYVEKAATCVADGTERRDCGNCSHYETKSIAAEGHSYDSVVTDPTCTAKGYTTYTCACGDTYVSDYVDAKGHDYEAAVTAPTCTAKGYTTYTCACGDTYVSDYTDEADHSYAEVVTAPTCVAKGYTTYTCTASGCQHSYVGSFVDANGHSWNIDAPTCTEDQICSVCDETNEATGHDIYLESTTPATCTAAAVNNYKCHNCEEYSREESVGTPTEHNITGVTPTLVLNEGETCVYTEHYECLGCGADVTGKEVVTHEKYTAAITKAATCVEAGIKTLTCAACGETKTEEIPVDTELGHNWDEGVLEGTTRTYSCQHEGCEATKSVYDASGETSVDVSSDDLKNELALKDANLNFGGAGIEQDVTVGADTLTDEDKGNLGLSDEALEQVGDNPIYNFTMTSGETTITTFDGYVIITIPYVLAEGEDVDSIAIWYIEGEELVSIPATYNNGYVTFKTNHFSYYTVTRLTPKQRCKLYGHNFSSMTVDPTCTEQGYELHSCIRCGHSEKDNFVDPINHSYITTETPAGCTTSGLRTYICGNCAHSYTEEIAPRGHVYDSGVITTPATCTTAGLKTYTCDCGVTKTEAIPSTGHSYNGGEVTAATCTEKGYTTYVCENDGCEHTYVGDFVDATGHSFSDWYVHAAPTCIMHGLERRDCETCEHFETRLIDAKGHDYETTVTEPTCTEQGYTSFVCKNEGCRDKYVGELVPAKGHSYESVVTAPTCISKGYTTYTCDCGSTYVADYTATIDHSYEAVVTAPTCISKGYTTYTCSIEGCGDTYQADYTSAVDHSYGEWKTVAAVTCTESGLNRRDCENCDHFENEVVAAIGHNDNAVVTDATCTEQGYTTYSCTNEGCGHVYVSDYVPAKGHSYESAVTEPTCDESGYTTHTCSCGDEYTDSYTSPVGHDYEAEWEWEDDHRHARVKIRCKHSHCHHHHNPHEERIEAEVRGFDSTCDKKGRDEYHVHFEFGGKSFSDKREDEREKNDHSFHDEYQWNKDHHWHMCEGCSGNSEKIPHEFDEGTVTITPNCIKEGEKTYKCACGYTKTEKLSKTETHTASREVYHNADAHWNVCIHCGEVCNVSEHSWDEGRVTKSANCSEEGIMTYRCSCTETKTEAIPTNSSHDYKDVLTYDENGHWGECSRCGDGTEVVAHEFGSWKTVKAPSCTEEGTKQHKCVCGYTETEAIPVVEHNYIANTGDDAHWNECRVCGDKTDVENHNHDVEIKLDLPSCISAGVRITACSCGHWNTEILPPNDIHDYSVPAFDENGHWTECKLCGHKSEVENHSYNEENAVIVTAPTCIHEGLAEIACECGHKTTVALEPTDVHEYEDGFCKHCGAEEINCDHDDLTSVTIDMAELGFCGGYVSYETCECGKNVKIDQNLQITCENLVEGEYKDGVDENGNEWMTTYVECLDCGLRIDLYATAIYEGCLVTVTYKYTFSDKDGKVFLEAYEGWSQDNHSVTESVLGIADKTCGTDISVNVCTECGKVISINDFIDVSCELMNGEPEYEYDENGEPISVTVTVSCEKCGLTVIAKMGVRWIDSCTFVEYEIYEVYAGGELCLEYSKENEQANHEYETTYEMLGESCEDGVRVTHTCVKCGETESYTTHGHHDRYEEFNTADYGMCDGWGYRHVCQLCGEVTYVHIGSTNCCFETVSYDEETGLEIQKCTICGVERHASTVYSEKDENCNVLVTVVDKYYVNGELVLDGSYTERWLRHNEQYTYEFLGESCDDGVRVYVVCADCGMSYENIFYGHDYYSEEFNTADYGMCDGWGHKDICRFCDEVNNAYVYTDCYFELVSIDETGLEILRCVNCGAERHASTVYSEKDENCNVLVTIVDKYYVNGELVIDMSRTENHSRHNEEYTYELLGATCGYGVRVYVVCADCGFSYDYVNYGHSCVYEEVDLGSLGLCSGIIYRNRCVACGWEEDSISEGCNWVVSNDVALPEGTPITFFIRQAYTAKVLYLDGGVSGRYLTTTDDPTAAIEVYAEKSGSGYSFYYLLDGQKQYIYVGYNESGKLAVCYSAESASVFTYRLDVNAWTTFVDGAEYYIGTYKSYETVSVSRISYISPENTGVSQFPVEISEAVVDENTKTVCSVCGAEKTTTMEVIWTDSCNYQQVYTTEYYLNGALVCTSTHRTYGEQHNYSVEYVMYGESCSDGYEMVYTCSCGHWYSVYNWGHNIATVGTSLSDYGITCGGTHYRNVCTVCHEVTEEWVEEACDWHAAGVTLGDAVIDPTADTAYVAYMDQRIAGKTIYLDGGVSGKWLTTTTDPTKAISVYAEAHEGGFAFYTLVDGVKIYICASLNDSGKSMLYYGTDNIAVFTYYVELGTWVVIIDDVEYFFGAYNAFETVGASGLSYVTTDNVGVSQFPIKLAEISISEDCGYSICSICGTERHESEELIRNGCDFTHVTTVSYVISGETVLSVSNYNYYSEHHFEIESIVMYGESCEDGFSVTYVCSGCGGSYTDTLYHHEILRVYEADFESSDSCKHHYAYFESCPCGEMVGGIYADFENLQGVYEVDEENMIARQGYVCADCGFSVMVTMTVSQNGCTYTETVNLDVIIDGAVDYNYSMSYDSVQHENKVVYIPGENGGFTISNCCEVCGEGTVTEFKTVTITYNKELGYYSYDLYFTPDVDGTYYIYSVCSTDTDVELYRVLDDGSLEFMSESGNRYWNNFGCKKTLTAGVTYVYRIFSHYATGNTVVPYNISMVPQDFVPNHCNEHGFNGYTAYPENYVACKDNTYEVALCSCGCGYVGYVRAIAPVGDHEYEGGVCVNCGAECAHEAHELNYINLADYGFCGGIVLYYTCECGEYSFYDLNEQLMEISCENTVDSDESGMNEDGTMWQKQIIECLDCGMYVELYITANQCYHVTGAMTFYTCKDGEVVLNLLVDLNHNDHQETEQVGIGLGDKVCGGDIYMSVCTACGQVFGIDDMDLTCNLVYSEEQYNYLDNGVEVSATATCADCGLCIVAKQYQYQDGCRVTYGMLIEVYTDGELFYTWEYSQSSHNHNFGTSYDYDGTSCQDGYDMTVRCYGCGFELTVRSHEHPNTYEEYIDVTELGFCGGYGYKNICNRCGEVTRIYVNPYACCFETVSYDEATGVEIQRCTVCGAERHYAYNQSEKDENCKGNITETNKYYVNGELVFDGSDSWTYEQHNYEYSYELLGETCDDGYIVTVTCTDCGYTYQYQDRGHNTVHEDIDWVALGVPCGGYGYRYVCQICGEQTRSYGYTYCSYTQTGVDEETGAIIYTCVNEGCGSVSRVSQRREDVDSCHYYIYYTYEYYVNDTLIFTREESSYYETHQWVYEYIFDDPENPNCEAGVTVNYSCSACGVSYSNHDYSHGGYLVARYDLASYGACEGGYIEAYECPCGEYKSYSNYINCSFSNISSDSYTDENGVTHTVNIYACSNCGLTRTRDRYNEKEGCYVYRYNTYTYTMGDVEICSYEEKSHYRTEHTYTYTYEFADPENPNCEAGVTVNYTCTACGESGSNYNTYHYIYRIYTADFASLGCCTDKHSFRYSSCPCGESYGYDYSSGLSYNSETGLYHCADCAYTVSQVSSEETDGCVIYTINTITMYVDGNEIYSFRTARARVEHDFVISASLAEDGSYSINMVCKSCAATVSTSAGVSESHTVSLENHDGIYYYDFTFVPAESAYYTIVSATDGDTYVELYHVVDGDYDRIGSNDDGAGYNYNFKLTSYLEAGSTYVYRIRFNSNSKSGDISFSIGTSVETEGDSACKSHSYSNVQVLAAGADSCEDGVFVINMCSCGAIRSVSVSTIHNVIQTEVIELSEYGASGGRAYIYSCACGEQSYMVEPNSCSCGGWYGNNNEYVDEDGIRWYVYSLWTECECNIRYDRKYYYVYDAESCTRTMYRFDTLSVGNNLVADLSMTQTETWHDYEVSYELVGTTCSEGVNATYTCRNCGESYEDSWSHCRSIELERIYLEEHGSLCGGYVSIYGCPCGNNFSFNVNGAECHFDHKSTNRFIEGDIHSYQYTADGHNGFYTYSYIYTCSVTDPEQCGFAIRYSDYWKKNEGDCSATHYFTIQLGYSEAEGTWAEEITTVLGTKTYHNYEYSSTENGSRYDCPDCGSYYSRTYEYNENGHNTKSSEIYVNTLEDGRMKYRENTYEYLGEDLGGYLGNPHTLEYYKYVYADGSEYWNRYEYSYTILDEAPYGDFAYERETVYTNSNGGAYTEGYAYFVYEGYSFTMYSYRTESSGYWYRRDYSYDFSDGCKRTETYTNSNGETRVSDPQSAHPTWWTQTIKNPTCTQPGIRARWCPVCEHHWNERATSPTEHNWVMLNNGIYYCYDCGLQNINGATGDIVMEDMTAKYGNGEAYVIGYYLKSNHQFTPFVLITLHEPVVLDGEEYSVFILDLTEEQIHFVEDEYVGIYVTLADIEAAVAALNEENGLALTSDMYDVTITLVPDGADSLFDYAITFADLPGAEEIDYVIKNTEFIIEYVAEGETVEFTICPETSGYWEIEIASEYYGYFYISDSNESPVYGNNGYHQTVDVYFTAGETYTVTFTMSSTTYECYVAFSFTQTTFE